MCCLALKLIETLDLITISDWKKVHALRYPASPKQQLAIDTNFLNKNSLYKNKIEPQKLLVVTDGSGANRVYDPKNVNFLKYDRDSTLLDDKVVNGRRQRVNSFRKVINVD